MGNGAFTKRLQATAPILDSTIGPSHANPGPGILYGPAHAVLSRTIPSTLAICDTGWPSLECRTASSALARAIGLLPRYLPAALWPWQSLRVAFPTSSPVRTPKSQKPKEYSGSIVPLLCACRPFRRPGLGHEGSPPLASALRDFPQMQRRPRKSVQLGDHQRVALSDVIDCGASSWPLPATPRMPGTIHRSHSGFRAIQKIASIQVSSGFIRGIPI